MNLRSEIFTTEEPRPDRQRRGGQRTRREKSLRVLRIFVIYAILGILLWWALRMVPFAEIWDALKGLKLWQFLTLLGLNALVLAAMTARWWAILRAGNPEIPFLQLVRYRLSVFGLSYFTPGPQVGGEPLQVIYLQRNHGLTFARATSAVIMDKLLEFLANFVLPGWVDHSQRYTGFRESDSAGGDFAVAACSPGAALSRQISRLGTDACRYVPHQKPKMDAPHHRLRAHGWRVHPSPSRCFASGIGILVAGLGRDGCRIFRDGWLFTGASDGRTIPGGLDRLPIGFSDALARRVGRAGS